MVCAGHLSKGPVNTAPPLFLRLLGDTTLLGEGAPRALPKSRKTRALLAYLAIEARPIHREALCEMFWASAADPRAALRWSLTQLRPLLATPLGQALQANAHSIAINRALLAVDVWEVKALLEPQAIEVADARLQAMEEALAAGYSADLDLGVGSRYELWLGGEREALRRIHRRVLDEQSARAVSPQEALAAARKRVALDPLDSEANAKLLERSVEVDGIDRARAALEGMRARYRAEGLSDHALVASWRGLEPTAALELPDKPSVAVLGFTDLGGHADGPVLAEGLAADLTLTLGRFRGLFVIARASSVRFAAGSIDLPRAGRMLGVRYLVHGTTQRLDRRVRVTVTLTDAQRNAVVWSEHFDRSLADLFSVQDDVSSAIASTIEPEIARAEAERAGLKAPEDLSAWECYHRAMWHCYRFTAQHTEQAYRLLQRALTLEKGFARAHAGLSFTHYSRAFLNATPAPDAAIAMALEHGQLSVDLDARDAMGHWTLGRARFLAREHDQALQSVKRSLAINPSFSQGHYALGFMEAHCGLQAQAMPDLAAAERLSPLDPLLFAVEGSRAISLMIEGRFEQAAAWSVRASSEPNAHFHIQAIAGACLAMAGREQEAQAFAQRACRDHPGYSVRIYERSFPQKFAAHQAVMAQALRSAGVPDGEA
jgi:TolB-like protein/DNA-binding SARP family transcriptional activator